MTKKTLARILVNLIFSILYSILLVVGFVGIGIFAMGCGGSCTTNPFLKYLFLSIAGISVVLLIIQSLILRLAIKDSVKTVIGWILGSFLAIPLLMPVLFGIVNLATSKGTQKIVDKMNAPFYDAQKFHPRVTFISSKINKNSTGMITSIEATIRITAQRSGKVEVFGGLYNELQTSEFVGNSAEISESKIVTIGSFPTEVSFELKPLILQNGTTRPLESLSIFGVHMNYLADINDYTPDANILYNPIDDVDDSGRSSIPKMEDKDDRTVFYSLK